MNKYKTIIFIIALIIVLGAVIALTAGYNVRLLTKEHIQIHLDLGKEFNKEDIKNITNEVLPGQPVEVQKVEAFEDQVLISTNEITDEQKESLVTKINEKYATEIKAEDITTDIIPKIALKDYITPHIFEFILVTVIIAIYEVIRYRKLGSLKVLGQTLLGLLLAQMLLLSILVITRLQVGNNLVAVMLVTYAVTAFGLTITYENKLQKIKIDEANNNK